MSRVARQVELIFEFLLEPAKLRLCHNWQSQNAFSPGKPQKNGRFDFRIFAGLHDERKGFSFPEFNGLDDLLERY